MRFPLLNLKKRPIIAGKRQRTSKKQVEQGSSNRKEGAPDEVTRMASWVGDLTTPPIPSMPAWWDPRSRTVPSAPRQLGRSPCPLPPLSPHPYEKDVEMVSYFRAQDLLGIMSVEQST